MTSIRGQLLGGLVPGFILICALAGTGIYLSERHRLELQLDSTLMEMLGDASQGLRPPRERDVFMPGMGRRPPHERELQKEEPAFFEDVRYKSADSGMYFEHWTPEGDSANKSENLGESHLEKPTHFSKKTTFYNRTLANGDTVRMLATHQKLPDQEPVVDLVFAASRRDADTRLSQLGTSLFLGALACCLALSTVLILVLRFALNPLRQLGSQAAKMGPETLGERFMEDDLPSEMQPIVGRLNLLMERLEHSFERERRFSGNLAHELRTPLAAIRSTSEVAVKWPDQNPREDFIEITQLATRLQQTLDSLLILARTENSSEDLITETVSAGKLVQESIDLHKATAEDRNLVIIQLLDQQIDLDTNPRLLRIIFTNLIGNAVEYAPSGSNITVTLNEDGTIFQCSNPAPTLNSEDLPLMFDRLWRKDTVRTESGHTGLGLSIAKNCADALGYQLSAEYTNGQLKMSLSTKS